MIFVLMVHLGEEYHFSFTLFLLVPFKIFFLNTILSNQRETKYR